MQIRKCDIHCIIALVYPPLIIMTLPVMRCRVIMTNRIIAAEILLAQIGIYEIHDFRVILNVPTH